jgi:type IV secretion system protein VirB2
MIAGLVLMATAVLVPEAWAADGGSMPWDGPLQQLIDSITGPVARAIGVASIFIFGGMMALSEGGGLRVVLGIVFGLSIMFGAVSWGLPFFGFAEGALI